MCIGLEKGTLKLIPFSKNWKRLFNEEKRIFLDIIGDFILDIEHIGSTAIEGALAKPIIDILISLRRFEDGFTCVKPLENIGYEFRGEYGHPGRHYFVKGRQVVTHHVHMFEKNHQDFEKYILFRDYLNSHPYYIRKYCHLKRELSEKYRNNRELYTESKTHFIDDIINKALEERELCS
ncbi:GrpB family protein [candidate division WOR-3 bacterium]|nr:GrpB family protein [candidate division WOR-3 bacterium]